ncbi:MULTISPECIES: MgtC/SapB family protein [Enterococcus]|uniref:MgtC/SapB family protein n=1 Tax=Enterococcus sp. AZ103 TaxID=2774628 RepID=UPI003F2999D4
MNLINILEPLLFSILVSSMIGYNRETKSSPAGMRTYNLVCLGAVILTIISKELSEATAQAVITNPELKGIISADSSKIIAQIVSGIGFLGAGTIIVSQKRVKGLSTASSLWVTAAIGIAVGLGYYLLALFSSLLVVVILATFNKIIPFQSLKNLAITISSVETEKMITEYFKNNQITVKNLTTKVYTNEDRKYYTNVYTIKPHHVTDMHHLIIDLARIDDISSIEILDV